MPENNVRLEIGSELYGGWKSIRINRSLYKLAGSFQLSVTEKWPSQEMIRPIKPGQSCRVLIDTIPVITGYVDSVDISYSGKEHTLSVSGRDKTCDLVDCCSKSLQLQSTTLANIASIVTSPFNIEVVDLAGTKNVPTFKTNIGDTVFETLDQLTRAQGLFMTTDGKGNLVFTRAGSKQATTVLELGKNILSASGKFSMVERFSEITILGQSSANENWNREKASQIKTTVKDSSIPRFRPLVLVAEQEYQGANKRGQWEVNTRYGKGNSVHYTVLGWYDKENLWEPNSLVSIKDPFMGLDVHWLCGEVTYNLGQEGMTTELILCPKEAFEIEPI